MLHLMCPSAPPGCPAQDGRRKLASRPLSSHSPPLVSGSWGCLAPHPQRWGAAARGQCRAQAGWARAPSRVPCPEQPGGHHLHSPAHAASQPTGARPHALGSICSTRSPSSPPALSGKRSPATPVLSRLSTGDSVSQGRGGRAARAQSYGRGDGLPAATLRPLVRWHVYRVRVRPPRVWSWQGERAQVEAVRSLPKSPLRPRPGWAVTEASRPPLLAPVSAAGGDLSGPNCCLAQPVTDPILQTAEPRVV